MGDDVDAFRGPNRPMIVLSSGVGLALCWDTNRDSIPGLLSRSLAESGLRSRSSSSFTKLLGALLVKLE